MINVGGGRPFTPTPQGRRRQTSREIVLGIGDRAKRQRMTPVEASECLGQNADLGRAFGSAVERGARRARGRARVDVVLADAAMDNRVARYDQDRREMLELISRARSGARRPSAVAVRSASNPYCAKCQDLITRCNATPDELAAIGCECAYRTEPSSWLPCRTCGVPADQCVCNMAVR